MSQIAALVRREAGLVTFEVDPVTPAARPLALEPARALFQAKLTTPLLTFSHPDETHLVQAKGNHPLVTAVHLAFSQHRPLLLTPDSVWLTVAQGFARHVNIHAEALRDRFVPHQGRQTVSVSTAADLSEAAAWGPIIDGWIAGMRPALGPGRERLLVCDFSTTTPTARTASQIVMMDAFKQYFDYVLLCVCGIPQITLLGTPADWRDIRARVAVLEEYELAWWTERLLPICDALVETAEGRPPLAFWRAIYKPEEVYGGEVITGWLADLFPYLEAETSNTPWRNPILAKPQAERTVEDGLWPSTLPNGLSQAPFTLDNGKTKTAMQLVAGFVGVAQDRAGQLAPEIGWGVCEQDGMARLIERIVSEHTPGPAQRSKGMWNFHGVPAELMQLTERCDGATLFADSPHPWRIRPLAEYEFCTHDQHGESPAVFIDLADGRSVAYHIHRRPAKKPAEAQVEQTPQSENEDEVKWLFAEGSKTYEKEVLLLVGRVQQQLNSEPIYAYSATFHPEPAGAVAVGLRQLFERIFAAGGRYFFDAPDFTPERHLETP